MQPAIPSAIEKVIARLDQAGEPVDEHQAKAELVAARNELKDPPAAENLGAWAEVLAFALEGGTHGTSPWGTYFRPLGQQLDRTVPSSIHRTLLELTPKSSVIGLHALKPSSILS
jgi:hypothetical protein